MNEFNRESTFTRCVRNSLQCLAVAIPLLLVVHGPARAASVCEPTAVATLDQRLAAKADEGVGSLRRFVDRTRTIYQLDMTEAAQRADRQRRAVSACSATVASRS